MAPLSVQVLVPDLVTEVVPDVRGVTMAPVTLLADAVPPNTRVEDSVALAEYPLTEALPVVGFKVSTPAAETLLSLPMPSV